MKKKINILTGPIQSGKTTSLFKFIHEQKSVDGILAPIIDDKRVLYHIMSRTIKILETDQKGKGIITIGKYNFFEKSFEWARQKLIYAIDQKPKYLIIDEYGKLELGNKGLEPEISQIIFNNGLSSEIILVVRDYLLDIVIKKLQLSDRKIPFKIIESIKSINVY